MNAKPSFFAELQRRHVYKVGATYAVAGWLLAQVVTQVLPVFNVSLLGQRILVLVLIAGFPVALVLAWLFDITPDGIVRTEDALPGGEPQTLIRARGSMDRKLNYVLGVLLLLGACYIAAERMRLLGSAAESANEATVTDKSIAVLPFESLSDDKANAYFAQGIQDEILTQLAKLGDLRVISRTSTQRYATNPTDLREVARQLGVENILEGSVQKSGNTVHVNVQLIRAATDDHLWAESYDRKLDEVFSVEGEVAGDIAGQLHARLSGAEQQALGKAATDNPQAYNTYLQALALDATAQSRKALQSVIDLYQKAVTEDPKFADAWTHLAAEQLSIYGQFGESKALAAAKDAVDTALRLQPESAKAWRVLGWYRMDGVKDYATAAEAFAHALRIAPNDPHTLSQMGNLKIHQGSWDEALTLLQKASASSPRDSDLWATMAEVRYAQRRFPEARSLLQRAADIDPKDATLINEIALTYLSEGDVEHADKQLAAVQLNADYSTVVALSQLARQKHDTTATIAEFEHLLSKSADLDVIEIAVNQFELGNLNLCAGRPSQATTAFKAVVTSLELARKSNHVDPFLPMYLAPAYAALGRKDAAIESAQEGLSLAANDFERRPTALTFLAQAQMLNGDSQAATETLSELLHSPGSFFTPSTPSVQQLRQDCLWNPLRKDAAFQALLSEQPSKIDEPKP